MRTAKRKWALAAFAAAVLCAWGWTPAWAAEEAVKDRPAAEKEARPFDGDGLYDPYFFPDYAHWGLYYAHRWPDLRRANYVTGTADLPGAVIHLGGQIHDIRDTLEQAVLYDTDENGQTDFGQVTLQGEGGTKISGLADGEIVVGSTDAVTGGQLAAAGIIPGQLTEEETEYSVAVGQGSMTAGKSSTALGYQSKAMAEESTAIGRSSGAKGQYSTAIGARSQADGEGNTALGAYSWARGDRTAEGDVLIKYATAVGYYSYATRDYSTALGYQSHAMGKRGTALGAESEASGKKSTAVGAQSEASEKLSTALGANSHAIGVNSTALGARSQATAGGSTAVGVNSKAKGENSTALGYDSKATGYNSMALGYKSAATNSGSVALGAESKASGQEGTAIGYRSEAKAAGSVALGYNSFVGKKDILDGEEWRGVISVGDSRNDGGFTRRIINVAAGVKDTDAVNYGQMKSYVQDYVDDKLKTNGSEDTTAENPGSSTASTEEAGQQGQDAGTAPADSGSGVQTASAYSMAMTGEGTEDSGSQSRKNRAGAVKEGDTQSPTAETNAASITSIKNHIGTNDDGSFAKLDNGGETLTEAINTNTSLIQQNSEAITALGRSVSQLGGEIDSVGAISAALAGLHPLSYGGDGSKLEVAAALGTYDGTQAMALGGFYHFDPDTMLSFGASMAFEHEQKTAANLGVTFRVGQGSSGGAYTPGAFKAMQQELTAVKADNHAMKEQLADVQADNADLRSRLEEMEAQMKALLRAAPAK